jgi:3-phosphoshikimate 1-carboxyvinyltransferase
MMNRQLSVQAKKIKPISQPINVVVSVPGSKSLTNRALLIAALSDGKTMLTNALFSDDTNCLTNALQTLGFNVVLDIENTCIKITGLGGSIPAQQANLFIGNAGTAARFLTAFLTLGNGTYTLDGDSRMRERPIGDLLDALTQLGAKVETISSDQLSICPPVRITASGLQGGKTRIAGNISSQFLSALLMTAPYAKTPVEIEITTELNSKPYVDMTLSVMTEFGVEVDHDGYGRFSINSSRYRPLSNYLIESDASSASYFFAAPAICGGSVRVENISRKSKQGDIEFLDILARMGCVVTEYDNSIEVAGPKKLIGIDINMRDIPDTAQTLAVVAPFASSPTRIRGITSARVKETDRISATCAELRKIGVQVDEHEDGMTIYPSEEFRETFVKTYNDHRMAMAFSLIGLRTHGIKIENPGCVSKTFPNYFDVLETLR